MGSLPPPERPGFAGGLVSTIIPVYNRAAMLREAVASVLAQTYRPIDVIIVDDGSTDDTPEACAELGASHPDIIRVVRTANGGPGAAREAGRLLAGGEFIQYLDSDDLLHPCKFQDQVAALRARPDCGVAYCKTREYEVGAPDTARISPCTDAPVETLFPSCLSGRRWQTPSPLFRRAVTDEVGPWTSLRQEEDLEYDGRVGALGVRLAWCPEILVDVRHHVGSRAGGNSLADPQRMRGRCEAHSLIYQHARRHGIGPEDPHMQRYARELFLLARQCGAAGLAKEARDLFELARQASGPVRARGLDFRVYRGAAALVGWGAVGRIACWSDAFRRHGTQDCA